MAELEEFSWEKASEARKRRRREFQNRQIRKRLIQYVEPYYTSEPEIPEPIKRECVFCHWVGYDGSTLIDQVLPNRNFRAVPTYKHKDDMICHLCDTQYIPFRGRRYVAQ